MKMEEGRSVRQFYPLTFQKKKKRCDKIKIYVKMIAE
jgi:hypothetical protein